jgi:hypothetical protein
MEIICNAGTFLTASFDTSHVVPQKMLTQPNANKAFLLVEVRLLLSA